MKENKGKFDQTQYIIDYKREKYSRIPLDVTKDTKERWKNAADSAGEKLAVYIKTAVETRIESEKGAGESSK